MSIIIIRRPDAERITDNKLKNLAVDADGWSISYCENNDVSFQRDMNMKNFIPLFRQLEKENLTIVVHLNQFMDGDKTSRNLLPGYVKDTGTITTSGYISEIKGTSPKFKTGELKSDEIIISELYSEYTLNNANNTIIQNWNKFINKYEENLENMTLVLLMNGGRVLNSRPEYGIYSKDTKLWISDFDIEYDSIIDDYETEEIPEIVNDEYLELNYSTAIQLLDSGHSIELENIATLSLRELINLCYYFPQQVAELLKQGQCKSQTYIRTLPREVSKNSPLIYEKCSSCEYLDDINFLRPFKEKDYVEYLCLNCVN